MEFMDPGQVLPLNESDPLLENEANQQSAVDSQQQHHEIEPHTKTPEITQEIGPNQAPKPLTIDEYRARNRTSSTTGFSSPEPPTKRPKRGKPDEFDSDVLELNYSSCSSVDEENEIAKNNNREFEKRVIKKAKFFHKDIIQEAREKSKDILKNKLLTVKQLIDEFRQ